MLLYPDHEQSQRVETPPGSETRTPCSYDRNRVRSVLEGVGSGSGSDSVSFSDNQRLFTLNFVFLSMDLQSAELLNYDSVLLETGPGLRSPTAPESLPSTLCCLEASERLSNHLLNSSAGGSESPEDFFLEIFR